MRRVRHFNENTGPISLDRPGRRGRSGTPQLQSLRLAPDRGRGRVLDLHPTVGAAGSVGRTEPLRHDTLAAERAGLLVDDRAVARVVLIEGDAFMGVTESFARMRLRSSIGVRRRSSPSSSSRSNAQSTAAASCRYPRSRSKTASPRSLHTTGFAIDQARAHRQHGQGGYDLREAVREVIAIGPSSLQRLTIFGNDRRHSGHF